MAENVGAAFYLDYAAHCVEISRQVSDPVSRGTLLTMAQAWLALAEQADKNSDAPTLVYETPESREQPMQQQQQPQPKRE
jgi:hypothetical protein